MERGDFWELDADGELEYPSSGELETADAAAAQPLSYGDYPTSTEMATIARVAWELRMNEQRSAHYISGFLGVSPALANALVSEHENRWDGQPSIWGV